jgi:hypothetical protein
VLLSDSSSHRRDVGKNRHTLVRQRPREPNEEEVRESAIRTREALLVLFLVKSFSTPLKRVRTLPATIQQCFPTTDFHPISELFGFEHGRGGALGSERNALAGSEVLESAFGKTHVKNLQESPHASEKPRSPGVLIVCR